MTNQHPLKSSSLNVESAVTCLYLFSVFWALVFVDPVSLNTQKQGLYSLSSLVADCPLVSKLSSS